MINGLTKTCSWVAGECLRASCTLPGSLSCVVAKVGQGDERLGGRDGEKGVCDLGQPVRIVIRFARSIFND